MRRQRRLPTPAEMALWHSAVADTKPLESMPNRPSRKVLPPAPTPPKAAAATTEAAKLPPTQPPARRSQPILEPGRPVGIDRRNWLRLKRGQIAIERSVDLHGLTQQQAHRHLAHFLADAQQAGLRAVLVVTGKGGLEGGVLRQMVPRWLNEGHNRDRVLAVAPAQPRHGGGGALYLLLRRKR